MFKTKYILSIILSASFFSWMVFPGWSVSAQESAEFRYLAIGDSIAKGYSCDDTVITPYPILVQESLMAREQSREIPVVMENISKNGISAERFKNTVLSKENVHGQIRQADLITITIGANDLIDEFKRASQDVLGTSQGFWSLEDATSLLDEQVKSQPTLVLKGIAAIAKWDYDYFEANYCGMMEQIRSETKASTEIVVTNIYNPTTGLGMPGTLGKVIDSIIARMNDIIEKHAQEYNYRVVDLAGSTICDYVQRDGLHPTQEGQQLIASAVLEEILWGLPKEKKDEVREKKPTGAKASYGANVMAVVAVGTTGILLLLQGMWTGKGRKKSNEDTSDSN